MGKLPFTEILTCVLLLSLQTKLRREVVFNEQHKLLLHLLSRNITDVKSETLQVNVTRMKLIYRHCLNPERTD